MPPEYVLFKKLQEWREMTGDSFSEGYHFDASIGIRFMLYNKVENDFRVWKQEQIAAKAKKENG